MRFHIRGNFGTQILQAALACARTEREPILCVNIDNLPYDGSSKLHLVFEPKCRIIEIRGTSKTPYWHPGCASEIFSNREKIFKYLEPKYPSLMIGYNAVHIRGGDKKICSDENYKKLIQMGENGDDRLLIFTDDEKYTKTLTDRHEAIYSEDAFSDWKSIYNAGMTWAAPSSFIMSMLLFDPNKKITFLGNKYCDGGYDVSNDLIFLEELLPFCPNITIC